MRKEEWLARKRRNESKEKTTPFPSEDIISGLSSVSLGISETMKDTCVCFFLYRLEVQ